MADGQLGDIQTTVHALDKRISVIETRVDAQESKLTKIEQTLDSAHKDIRTNTSMLQQHIANDFELRARVSTKLNLVLLSVIGSLALFLLTMMTKAG